jgi:trimethylamine--corrinoid protein Co-methyltransferase
MARGETLEQFSARPGAVTIINTNTPLQYDVPMANGVMDMARHGQVTFISPFVMAGASTPATMASSMAMTAAEMLCGLVLAQFTRPGAPVVFGNVSIPTDMRTGSPAYGMPDGFRAYLIGGQLARRYKMPSRMSNFSGSNVPDFASGFESAGSQYAMLMAGANVWMHLTGWVEGGLCTSYEKFVMDCELAQGLVHLMQPVEVSANSLALDEIAKVGPGGHFFGEQRTLETVETAFYRPMLSITQNYGAWMEGGGKTAEQRATAIWQEALANYQQPPLDAAIAAQMAEFVTRRKAEGGAAID